MEQSLDFRLGGSVVKIIPPKITYQERQKRIKEIKQVVATLWNKGQEQKLNKKQPASVTKRVVALKNI